MAVWGFQHGDLHADALEADDAVYPVTFDRRFAEHRQAELDEELGRGSEVGNHDAHILQTLNRHPFLRCVASSCRNAGRRPDPKSKNLAQVGWIEIRTICSYIDRTLLSKTGIWCASRTLDAAAMYSSGTPSTVSSVAVPRI